MTFDISHRNFKNIVATAIVAWALWALFGKCIIGFWAGDSDSPYENVGQFGDSFGALNALFAGIAAVGATFAATGWLLSPQIAQMDADFLHYNPLQKPACIAFVRLRVFAGVCQPRRYEQIR